MVDQSREFYNRSFKKWLKENRIEMYSTYIEGKFVVAEKLRTLKNKVYKHITAASKNDYFDVLNDNVNNCNNTLHKTIKMKPIDVKSVSYTKNNADSTEKYPRFEIGDHVTVSKYKNTFAKGYTPNWSEEIFVISKI